MNNVCYNILVQGADEANVNGLYDKVGRADDLFAWKRVVEADDAVVCYLIRCRFSDRQWLLEEFIFGVDEDEATVLYVGGDTPSIGFDIPCQSGWERAPSAFPTETACALEMKTVFLPAIKYVYVHWYHARIKQEVAPCNQLEYASAVSWFEKAEICGLTEASIVDKHFERNKYHESFVVIALAVWKALAVAKQPACNLWQAIEWKSEGWKVKKEGVDQTKVATVMKIVAETMADYIGTPPIVVETPWSQDD